MDDKALLTGWKLIAYAAIAVGALLVGVFRLDELIVRRKGGDRRVKRPMGSDGGGPAMYTDPDGRPWKRPKPGKRGDG